MNKNIPWHRVQQQRAQYALVKGGCWLQGGAGHNVRISGACGSPRFPAHARPSTSTTTPRAHRAPLPAPSAPPPKAREGTSRETALAPPRTFASRLFTLKPRLPRPPLSPLFTGMPSRQRCIFMRLTWSFHRPPSRSRRVINIQ